MNNHTTRGGRGLFLGAKRELGRIAALAAAICLGLVLLGCDEDPRTIAIHDPIYPTNSQQVAFSLEHLAGASLSSVRLFERVDTVTATGTITPGTEATLQTWTSPTATTLTFTKTDGYAANRLVTYRFEVTGSNDAHYEHRITFAIRPYPVANQPAPVFVVGDPDDVFDVVFIPDTDVTNQDTFRTHCRGMIRESFLDEPTTRQFRRSFNFYINPATGTATDYDRIATDGSHQVPSNWSSLSFAEGKVLLHQNNLRDYASGGLYSSEMQNRGTILHESGHGLFGLADEYPGGAHWQAATLPNNWSTQAAATAEATGRHKTAADVRQIGTDPWWKMCVDNCQMRTTGLTHTTYDPPCRDRVVYAVIDNAIQ